VIREKEEKEVDEQETKVQEVQKKKILILLTKKFKLT